MRTILSLVAAATLLAACGVEGPPVPPPAREKPAEVKPGISISGTVQVGVAGSF